jgi:hypothetical protein
MRDWFRRCWIALAALPAVSVAVSGCADGPASEPSDYSIAVVRGDHQLARSGAEWTVPFTVVVRDGGGAPAKGVRVRFQAEYGAGRGGSVGDSVAVTIADGTASVTGAAGASGDTLRVSAFLAALPHISTTFTAVATDGPVVTQVTPAQVRAGDTITFLGSGFDQGAVNAIIGGRPAPPLAGHGANAVRAIVPPCADTGTTTAQLVVGGAATAPVPITYRSVRSPVTLQPYAFTTVRADRVADCLELGGNGATYLLSAQFASVPEGDFEPDSLRLAVGSAGAADIRAEAAYPIGRLLRTAPRPASVRNAMSVPREFDTFRRALERTAGAVVRGPAALRDTVAPSEGSVRTFRVVTSTDGSTSKEVEAVLEYVGDHILVYGDLQTTRLSAEMNALLQVMDAHLWSEAVNAFGADPDVDGNGRIVVLFTPEVNRLVQAQDCLLRGYVRGFFYPPDLLERTPGSARGEVFYAFVPDPAGRYSCAHDQGQVVRELEATFLHEMEHLISFNEHVLARGGNPEEMWLNEGLGQIAEELGSRYFERAYPAPFGRSTSVQLFPDSSGPFIGQLLLDAYVYLNASLAHSVTAYEGAGSLEDQGATWLFLRWLIDQKGDGALRRLVQTRRTGQANLEAVAGESLGSLFGDFSLALFADSLPGLPRGAVPPRLRFQTRALRQLMAREATVQGFPNPFPLTTYLAEPGTALRAAMPPGTMLHAIVPTAPGSGSVRVSLTSPALAPLAQRLGAQVSILRLPP